jgi:hypothetical protein
MSKFAAMTASLLVRKGEAAPSTLTPLLWEDRPCVPVGKTHVGKAHVAPAPAPAAEEKPRRIVLNVNARDYERLGLVAVKRGVTRHSLAAEAMALYFEQLAEEHACACIGACRDLCAAE